MLLMAEIYQNEDLAITMNLRNTSGANNYNVNDNTIIAKQWLQRAAELGNYTAKSRLGERWVNITFELL